MTGRVLRTELRRGPFWGFLATMLPVAATAFPLIAAGPARDSVTWHAMAAAVLSSQVPLTAALTLAVAAWQGGRERRRGTGELLASTPRPRLQRVLAGWLPTLAWPLVAYTLGVLVIGAVLSLALHAGPPRMVALFAVAGVQLAAAAACGFVAGWYVPGRFVAPVAGVVAYIGLYATLNSDGYLALVLLAPTRLPSWEHPVWWLAPAAAVWFGGLAAASLAGAAARRRWLALVPLAVALLAAVPLTRTPVWRIDTPSLVRGCGPEAAQRITALPADERRDWQATADCATSGADTR